MTTSSAAEVVARREQLGAELPPAHVGLDAADQDDVAVQVGRRGHRDLGARPGDPAVAVLVGADDRPVDLEVVEVLRVDGADDPRPPHLASGGRPRDGRGVRGVVPALEGGDDHRVHQGGDVLDLDHAPTLVTPRWPAARPARDFAIRAGSATISSGSACGICVHVSDALPRLDRQPSPRGALGAGHRRARTPRRRSRSALRERILVIDGAMGTLDPGLPAGEEELPRRAVRRLAIATSRATTTC